VGNYQSPPDPTQNRGLEGISQGLPKKKGRTTPVPGKDGTILHFRRDMTVVTVVTLVMVVRAVGPPRIEPGEAESIGGTEWIRCR